MRPSTSECLDSVRWCAQFRLFCFLSACWFGRRLLSISTNYHSRPLCVLQIATICNFSGCGGRQQPPEVTRTRVSIRGFVSGGRQMYKKLSFSSSKGTVERVRAHKRHNLIIMSFSLSLSSTRPPACCTARSPVLNHSPCSAPPARSWHNQRCQEKTM